MIPSMTTLPGVIFCVASILLGTLGRTSSWVLSSYSQLPGTTTTTTMRPSPILIYIQSRSDIFSQDESDCPDEEECEIDWGAMPGFGDDDEDDTKKESSTKEQEATATGEGRHLIVDETDELEPQEVYVRKVERSVDTSRKILEMNWQIENCDVACSGTGAISPWAKTHDGTL